MNGARRVLAWLALGLLVAGAALASWSGPSATMGSGSEPSTGADSADGWMWTSGPSSGDRVYFAGQALPSGAVVATLGVWRDCNHDGFIGNRNATQADDYPAALGFDATYCPLLSPHNNGVLIHELRWIGPGALDLPNDARVWADAGLPGAVPASIPKTAVDVQLRFQAPNGPWVGQASWTTPPANVTLYAHVALDGSGNVAGTSIPASTAFPAGTTLGRYGGEPCGGTFGSNRGIWNGWECDPGNWTGTTVASDPYQLRDVD